MRGRIPDNLSILRSREPRPERAEPRLYPADAPLPFRRPAIGSATSLSASPEDEPESMISPAVSALDRRPAPAARRVGAVPYLAVAGLVVLAAGGVAGMRLLVPTPSGRVTAVAAADGAATPPQASGGSGAASPGTAASPPAVAVAIPSAPVAPHAAADSGTSKSPENVAPVISPRPSVSAAHAPAATTSEHIADPASKAAATTKVAAEPTGPAKDTARDSAAARRTASPPTGAHRPARIRIAEPHAHVRDAREVRSGEPKSGSTRTAVARQSEGPSRSAQILAPRQVDQAASFDRLMNQLTESTKPAEQTRPAEKTQPGAQTEQTRPAEQMLTPPAAGAPDPFSQHDSGEASPQ
jgi:hypothetical protein